MPQQTPVVIGRQKTIRAMNCGWEKGVRSSKQKRYPIKHQTQAHLTHLTAKLHVKTATHKRVRVKSPEEEKEGISR